MSSLIAIVGGGAGGADGLRRAIAASRRGPDAADVWTGGDAGLAHGLLQASNRSPGSQPATLDGEVWISADARIDDRRTLVRELEAAPEIRSPSAELAAAADHELLLHAYRAWGRRCVERLLGDFAFAIWDGSARRLFCARDQLGVAPLFYADLGDRLIVASELEPIRAVPGVPDELDDLTVADYLLFGVSHEPGATIYAGIRRLPAAHTLTWSAGRVEIERYWELQPPAAHENVPSEPTDELGELLEAAVGDRLADTDAAGISLSGGVDSALIAAIASRRGDADDRRDVELRAETVVFDHLIEDDERRYAGIAAEALGVPLAYRVADDGPLFAGWDDPVWSSPEPLPYPAETVNFELLRSLAGHGPVVLTGYDGDAACKTWLPSHFRRLLGDLQLRPAVEQIRELSRLTGSFPPRGASGIGAPYAAWRARRRARLGFPRWLDRDLVESLDLEDRWRRLGTPRRPWSRPPEADAIDLLTGPGMRYALDTCDPAWTDAAVDVRHPLLDLRVVRYLLALPPIPWKVDKTILRRLADRSLPDSISGRPKTPLVEDPVRAALRATAPADGGLRSSATERYVDPATLPELRPVASSDALWPRLRVIGLDRWIGNRTAPDGGPGSG